MECRQHLDRAATAVCLRCDAYLCAECIAERNGKSFCADCAAFVDQRLSRGTPPVSAHAAAPPLPTGPWAAAPRAQTNDRLDTHQELYAAAPVPPTNLRRTPPATTPADSTDDQGRIPERPTAAPGNLYEPPTASAPEGLYDPFAPGLVVDQAQDGTDSEHPSLLAMILVGILLISAGAGIWYGTALIAERPWPVVALLVGVLSGVGMRLVSKGDGAIVGSIAVAVYAAAIFGGVLLVERQAPRPPTPEAATARPESEPNGNNASKFNEDDIRKALGLTEQQWSEMTKKERSTARADILKDGRIGNLGELAESNPEAARKTVGVLLRVLEAQGPAKPEAGGDSSARLGTLAWLLLALGAAAAFKIGYG